MKRLQKVKGFFLLEVMVAVAILSIGLVVIIESFSLSLRATNSAYNLSTATLLAQKIVSEVRSGEYPDEGETSGDFGEDWPQFRWKLNSVSIPLSDLHPLEDRAVETEEADLMKVTISVFWKDRGGQRDLKVTTYLARREWELATGREDEEFEEEYDLFNEGERFYPD